LNEELRKNGIWAIIALILALGLIVSSYIAIGGYVKARSNSNLITVTGSAKKQIKSDLIVWDGGFSAQATQLGDAYTYLQAAQEKVKAYLREKGIADSDMIFLAISTTANHVMLPNGVMSNQIESYMLSQNVEIRSGDVDKITGISRSATELINRGVQFQSNQPQYFYTKLADLKIEMLSLATKDARTRADQIATNAGSRLGRLRTAKMGVFQITPLYSNDISDYGINDTTSIDKEITAVMNCQFEIR